jgi:putative SOS response-associated peptidase YedK
MCGRTALTASPEDVRAAFGLDRTPELTPRYNVPPSRPLSVVRVLRGPAASPASSRRTLESLRWGLVPRWADDPRIGQRLALARAETVMTTPAFREAIRARRCLVAVDAFYEWQREGKQSRPFVVRRPGGQPFALAGIWERWVSHDGEVVESCAILTRPARPPVDAIHDRMPVVLEPEVWDAWLDPSVTDEARITPMLSPRDPELVATEVGPYVNDPRHDDPGCFAAAAPAQRRLF